MKITYEGHSCFYLEGSKKILIDPFFSANPLAVKTSREFSPDLILVTHGHDDHSGDAAEIAARTGAPIAAPVELARYLSRPGVRTMGFNQGGMLEYDNIRVKMTPAYHSSSITTEAGTFYAGLAAGYIIHMDGLALYHAGDTGLFGDMEKVIARQILDVAFLPIGDYFTMGPGDALTATHWLKAKTVIPMHYNTFPIIRQDAEAFAFTVKDRTESDCRVLKPGESWEVS